MLIILLDEPGLFVFASAADAARDIEPVDAEQLIRAAFDESAVPYRVNWLRPSDRSKGLLGRLISHDPGEYEFVPAGPAEPAALYALLDRHLSYTHPLQAKADLEALRATLSRRLASA